MNNKRILVHDRHGRFWDIPESQADIFNLWDNDNRRKMPNDAKPAYWNTDLKQKEEK